MEQSKILESKIGMKLVRVGMLSRVFALQKFCAENHGITPEQFTILSALMEYDGMYQRQIATLTSKDRPNITRLIKILEAMELITKKPDVNKRKIYKIFITEKGKNMYRKVLPTILDIWQESIAGIPDEEVQICLKTLDKIKENLVKEVVIQN